MKLAVTPEAQNWFKEEVGVTPDTGIKFYGKIYGSTPVHEGFSVGMAVEAPEHPLVQIAHDGIVYFVEESDEWFFKGFDLTVDFNPEKEEPDYLFEKNGEDTNSN